MVCPFCEHKNAPNSAVCSHCGVILRGAAAGKHPGRHVRRSRRQAFFSVWLAGGLIVGAALGGFAGHFLAPRLWILAALVGALAGVAAAAFGGGGGKLYRTYRIRARHAHLQGQIKAAVARAEAHYESELKSPQVSLQTRLHLAALQLLKAEDEKAIQTLQTAKTLGASGAELENNEGVYYARRGSLKQALPFFQQAAARADSPAQPHVNQAHALIEMPPDPQASEQALLSVRDALKRAGNRAAYFDLLGIAFAREDRTEEARSQFERALTLADGNRAAQADARNNLGVMRHREGADREALAEFAAALESDPGHAHARANQGLLQYLGGEKEAGLARIHEAAHIDPRSAGVQEIVGFAECREGKINDGIRAYRQALAWDNHLFEPHANLGKAYADSGLPDVAENSLGSASKLQPRSWPVMQTLGVVKVALGQVPAAISCFESALKIKPQHPPLLVNLAISYALLGRDDEAKRRLEHAARLDNNNPLLHGHWGWLYLREDSATLAMGEIEIAVKHDPRSGVLHNNLGLAHVGVGALEVGLEALQRALRRDPHLHPVHFHLGAVHALLKNTEKAIEEWEIAAKYETANADCFTNLGASYYRKGDFGTAATHFRHVLQLRQNRPEDYSNLGLAYAKQGVALRKSADSVSKATAIMGLGKAESNMKQSLQMHKQAIELFDQALALDPRNVIIHSNRGLACFFANRAEDAMQEWGNVTRIDPLYVRRRGKAHQQEFDDSQVDFIPLDIPQRALMLPLATAEYLPRLIWGYDTARWEVIVSDPVVADLPDKLEELRALEQTQRALEF